MQYHIDTIPVLDAFEKAKSACPMCYISLKNEQMLCDRFLGASVMEPATRIVVNEKGFCKRHHRMLYDKQNRLGHALLMQSHLIELKKKLQKEYESLQKGDSKMSLFVKKTSAENNMLESIDSSCIICEKLDETDKRYLFTCLHLLLHNTSFPKLFEDANLCLHDLIGLINMGQQNFSKGDFKKLLPLLYNKILSSVDVLSQDIDWFTKKFDYRNQDKPWGNSRDAVERCMNFLRGHMAIDEKQG